MTEASERIAHIDIARALGIIAVILGHALIVFTTQPLPFNHDAFVQVRFIYAFHMPLFFFLSGLMHKPRDPATILTGSLALMILALLTQLVAALINGLLGNGWIGMYDMVRTMLLQTSFLIGVTWFLVSLAVVRVLACLWLQGSTVARMAVLFMVAMSLIVALLSEFRAFQIQTWWAGLAFYLAGHLLAGPVRDRLAQPAERMNGRWIGVMALGVLMAFAVTELTAAWNQGCLLDPHVICGSAVTHDRFIVRMIVGNYGFVPFFLLAAAAGTAGVMLLSALLTNLPRAALRYMGWVGKNTLTLLILNGFVLMIGNRILRTAIEVGYPSWVPVAVPLLLLIGHMIVLPLAIPVVIRAERISSAAACSIIARVPVPPLWPAAYVRLGADQAPDSESEKTA
jgi:acyltransferase